MKHFRSYETNPQITQEKDNIMEIKSRNILFGHNVNAQY